ncbi:MAG: aldo/keto reductase, partial [Tabrizicola sp.]
MALVALAWVRQKPGVAAPIVGYSRPEQFTDILAGLDLVLSPEQVARLKTPYVPTRPPDTREETMRIIVTGGSGKLGQECVRQLVEAGHEVIALDLVPPRQPLCRFSREDFTDYGQVIECMTHIDGGWEKPDALLHLAAIPGPSNAPNAHLFPTNVTMTLNVFWAAKAAGVRNIVWASSET